MWQPLAHLIIRQWVGPSPHLLPPPDLFLCAQWTQTMTVTSELGRVWAFGATSPPGDFTHAREKYLGVWLKLLLLGSVESRVQ